MDSSEFSSIVQSNPINRAILELLPDTGLNDVWLVSGCLFQTVWNDKTGRAPGYGIKDYDLFYYDDSDLSWDAEDTAIRQAMQALAGIDANIEIRNQARVHLWYPEKFGGCPTNHCKGQPTASTAFLLQPVCLAWRAWLMMSRTYTRPRDFRNLNA